MSPLHWRCSTWNIASGGPSPQVLHTGALSCGPGDGMPCCPIRWLRRLCSRFRPRASSIVRLVDRGARVFHSDPSGPWASWQVGGALARIQARGGDDVPRGTSGHRPSRGALRRLPCSTWNIGLADSWPTFHVDHPREAPGGIEEGRPGNVPGRPSSWQQWGRHSRIFAETMVTGSTGVSALSSRIAPLEIDSTISSPSITWP